MINRLELTENSFRLISNSMDENGNPHIVASGKFFRLETGLTLTFSATVHREDEVLDTLDNLHEALNQIEAALA